MYIRYGLLLLEEYQLCNASQSCANGHSKDCHSPEHVDGFVESTERVRQTGKQEGH